MKIYGCSGNRTLAPCNSSQELYHRVTQANIHNPYSPNYFPRVNIISLFAIFLICVTLCKEIKFSLRRKSKQVECQNNKVNVKTILVQIVTYWMM